MTLEPARTRRALSLMVEPRAGGEYIVSGGAGPHTVITSELPWTCDCRDSAFRPDVRCKHILGTYLHRQLAPAMRAALRSALGAS